jgi:hypothetical protein
MRKALWFVTLFVVPISLAAADVNTGSTSAAAAGFERLKALAGTWQGESDMGKAQATYEVIANGSVVLERITMDRHGTMVTAYHLDGDKLELTHYCMAGNQPSMVAKSINPATGEIVFDFASISNLTDPNAGYMHNASFQLADNNHFTAAWTFYENGKAKFTATLRYTRVQ